MDYRGALEINMRVREQERRQLLRQASEWSYVPRPGGRARMPVRHWLAAVLHGLAVRIEPRAAYSLRRTQSLS